MSIRLRLTIYWAIIIGFILMIAGIAVLVLFERQQWGALDGALIEEADTAAAAISRVGPGAASDSIVRNLSAERDLGPRRRVRIVNGNRVIADFGDVSSDLPPTLPDHFEKTGRGVIDSARGEMRFARVPLQFAEGPAILENGVDARAIRKSIARLRTSLLLILPLLLIAAIAGGYQLAGRALVPIITLAGELSRIEPRDLSRRLETGPVNDEVARLARTINALLERVERAANTERRFAVDAAHELRTPLAVLRTGLEVTLSHGRSPIEYRDTLASALHEVVALCTMADQLLTLVALDREATLERDRVDFSALIREVVDAVEPLLQAKQLTLAHDCGDSIRIEGNPIQLKRLVINLIDNALKFVPANGAVEVGVAVRDGCAILRVADSGPGIPADDLPFIFDRFFRGRARNESGNGLGLSLCREIVRLHHGTITAANRNGAGCEFTVTLPLAP